VELLSFVVVVFRIINRFATDHIIKHRMKKRKNYTNTTEKIGKKLKR